MIKRVRVLLTFCASGTAAKPEKNGPSIITIAMGSTMKMSNSTFSALCVWFFPAVKYTAKTPKLHNPKNHPKKYIQPPYSPAGSLMTVRLG